MVNKITNNMKDEVIRLYLQGESRNDIAGTCGLGEGTVSNIEDEWKHSLGIPDVQSLRDLAVNLKRCAIDAPQCAEGLCSLTINLWLKISYFFRWSNLKEEAEHLLNILYMLYNYTFLVFHLEKGQNIYCHLLKGIMFFSMEIDSTL